MILTYYLMYYDFKKNRLKTILKEMFVIIAFLLEETNESFISISLIYNNYAMKG